MTVPAQIRRHFEVMSPHLERVAGTVRDTVFAYCERHGYAYSGRRKTLESVAEKIESGRFQSWADITDLFACSIVIPTLADEPAVLEFLQGQFPEAGLRQRGTTQKPPDSFRFEATRYYGRLSPPYLDAPLDPIFSIVFEVQVRSAFEHAWSAATHAIYKSGQVSWKAKRLAAQLKAAVEQLDSLVLAFDDSARPIVEHTWPEVATQQDIADRLSRLAAQGQLPEASAPKDASRFAENLYCLIRSSNSFPRRDPGGFSPTAVVATTASARTSGGGAPCQDDRRRGRWPGGQVS